MPIYEFYCERCNTIFNFYSKTANTTKQPACPRCKEMPLTRLMSGFSIVKRGTEEEGEDPLPFDEEKMEKAMGMLAQGLNRIVFDSDYRHMLVEAGYCQITKFSWQKAAAEYISLYKEVLAS